MATLTIPSGALAVFNPIRKINAAALLKPLPKRFVQAESIDKALRRIARVQSALAEAQAEPGPQPVAMRGTPEIYFNKVIDNSRLVRVFDPKRTREMLQFGVACAVLFVFAMLYTWQHFSAIEYGYRIESQRAQIEILNEESRQLRLEQAALRDPQRIDQLARNMGLINPQVGQVVGLEPGQMPDATAELARANATATSVAP